MKKLLVASGFWALLSASCGGTEGLAPIMTEPVDAGVDAAPTTTSTSPPPPPPPDAGVVKRTVMTRSPFGGSLGNQLIDGDFEMSTSQYGGQLGWRGFSSDGSAEVGVATETGGLCHSGLRCAVMEPDTLFLVRGAAAKGKGLVASGWAKVSDEATCSRIHPMLIECDTFVLRGTFTLNGTEDGWCRYAADTPKQDAAMCVYVENTLLDGTYALLDSFVLGPNDGTVQPLSAAHFVPEALTLMRLEAMRARIIATTPFGRPRRSPPPSP